MTAWGLRGLAMWETSGRATLPGVGSFRPEPAPVETARGEP